MWLIAVGAEFSSEAYSPDPDGDSHGWCSEAEPAVKTCDEVKPELSDVSTE